MKRKTADKIVGLFVVTPMSMIFIALVFVIAILEWNGWYLSFLIPAFILLHIGLSWATSGIEQFEKDLSKIFRRR